MQQSNLGLCNQCRGRVAAEFFVGDEQIWIRKHCPDCGCTESLVSSHADTWQAKRTLWHYADDDPHSCDLHCDRCQVDHAPNMVFIDVTNRCNMNCPICIATIRGMGFDFNPPVEYFRKVFAQIAEISPLPVLLFFGGEPTVRNDLLEIVGAAKKVGLRPHIVTNGIRLADEDYCKKLCDARVPLRFAFDGRNADIYEKLRHNRPAYDKKMNALANLRKHSRRKHTIIATVGKGFNDQYLADFLEFCHENRDLISDVGMIPLTENWQPGSFDAGVHTTMEDVEIMVRDAVSGGDVEFIPAGLSYAMKKPRSFFRKNPRSEVLLLAGVHPNCESITLLVSDGKSFRSINHYLKKSFTQVAVEFAAHSRKLEPRLDRLNPDKPLQRLRGQLLIIGSLAPWLVRRVRLARLIGNPFATLRRLLVKRSHHAESNHPRRPRRLLRLAMLPFEEEHSIDAQRLQNCKAVFAYEDADDGKVKYIPACLWYPYRNALLKKIADKYDTAPTPPASSSRIVSTDATAKPRAVKT